MRIAPTVLVALLGVLSVSSATSQAEPEIIEHSGICDASAAVAAGPALFVVANDEDNVLRVYRNSEPGKPLQTFDLTSFLKPDEENPEADIEAVTQVGSRAYWITSHGASKKGKRRPSRRRLFATEVEVADDNVTITPIGTPYKKLVKNLAAAPQLKGFKLRAAAKRPPKSAGALNIEGLCATPDGTLLIAFRNPIPDGKALLVPLKNPQQVVAGESPELDDPIRLSLDGLGVRSIEYCQARRSYLVVAGPYDQEGAFKLYQWSGDPSDEPEAIDEVDFDGLNPEAMIVYPAERTKIQILSDDGTKEVDGEECKDAPPEKRSFRSVWVTP